MDEPHYPYERVVSEIKYDFWSISDEKEVKKRVIFSSSHQKNLYNLALVDVFEDGSVSDITETRNKYMRTVLATVINILGEFLEENSDKIVVFRGSDERRQRLYRLLIARELKKIQTTFQVYGVFDNEEFEDFQPNKPYEYFVITKL
jgi:hypothetical protein